MYLTDEEKRMLSGERGEAVRLSMEMLTKVGTIYGAERMLEIKSAHAVASYPHLVASVELMESFAMAGGQFAVPTTVNPSHLPLNFDKWKDLPEPEDLKEKSTRLVKAVEKMSVIPTYSCIPYFQGNLPRVGEHIAFAESSVISFVNSVLGARTNRNAEGMIEIAAAITGRTPEFGMHLEENRIGNVLAHVEYTPQGLYEYHTIGYIIGKNFGDRIPVIEGLPEGTTANQLKVLGASAAGRGAVPLYHAVGLTPEAKTKRQAFRGRKPIAEMNITRKEIESALEEITTYRGGDLDAVLIGCPYPILEEVRELALLLQGRKVKEGIKFCLFVSKDVVEWTRQMGYMEVLERAGVDVFQGDCILYCPVTLWGWKNVATNSAKLANMLPSDPTYLDVLFVDTKECVEIGTH
jgi:predicted aconitase